jgi:hypothetical protein
MPNQQNQVNQQNKQNNQYHEYNEQEFNSLPWAQDFLNADLQSKEFSNAMAEADKYYGPEWTDKQLNDRGIQFEKEIENGNITPDQLPDNSPIQKEAEQVTDNNPRNDEVDDAAVEEFIKQLEAQSPTKQQSQEDYSVKGMLRKNYAHELAQQEAWNIVKAVRGSKDTQQHEANRLEDEMLNDADFNINLNDTNKLAKAAWGLDKTEEDNEELKQALGNKYDDVMEKLENNEDKGEANLLAADWLKAQGYSTAKSQNNLIKKVGSFLLKNGKFPSTNYRGEKNPASMSKAEKNTLLRKEGVMVDGKPANRKYGFKSIPLEVQAELDSRLNKLTNRNNANYANWTPQTEEPSTDAEVNLSKKEQAELDAAQSLYDNINNAIDEMATMGKSKKSKAEKEADKAWLEEQELRDQVKMNPGKFLPEPYKQLVKAEPRDVDSYWEKVDNEYPFEGEAEDVQYTIRDDDEKPEKPEKPEMPTAGETLVIPPIKGKFYEPKTFGYSKPQINAGNINGVDNSLTLDNNGHTVAGGSTTKPSFSGSTGGASYTGGVVSSPSTPNTKSATPGRSFGGGHINLVGSGSNPVASASASNGGGVTSGAVVRTSDPNMSKGGHLSESRTQLPNGWANNQVPGGNLDISAGADYQDKDAMTSKGSLLSAKLEIILQEDSQTWDGNNSGDKYTPYVFFIGEGGQFYVQKGRERHAIKNIDDNEANELITVLTSNK